MNGLDSRIRLVWVGQALVTALLAVVVLAVGARFTPVPLWPAGLLGAALLVAGVAVALVRYRLWQYEVRGDHLYLERGVFTRVRTVVPFVRVQHVDSRRGPLERLVGLGSVVVYTAGSRGADVTIPGLAPADADALRERLKRLAIDAEGGDGV